MQRLRYVELVYVPDRPVRGPFFDEQSPVQQHADGFHRVKRHPLRLIEDPVPRLFVQAGDDSGYQLLHRRAGERLQMNRSLAASQPVLRFARPAQGDDEEAVVARPVEQVLHEFHQAWVRPLHVLEDEDDRRLFGQALEEPSPGGEEILPVAAHGLGEPDQLRQTRLDPASLLVVRHDCLDRLVQLSQGHLADLALEDAYAHPHHLGQGPVGDALAIGEAAAGVPEDAVHHAVDVLEELPGKPAFADAGDAGDRSELGLAVINPGVEQLFKQPELAVPPDKGRLQAVEAL
ncbi:MAG TPA: hypothetical protein VF137_07200 [Candidatus Dormibacteraeota bacterium]